MTNSELKLASKYGYREYPDYRRYDPINKIRYYYYRHPQYSILIYKVNDGWLVRKAAQSECIIKDFKEALIFYLPKYLRF